MERVRPEADDDVVLCRDIPQRLARQVRARFQADYASSPPTCPVIRLVRSHAKIMDEPLVIVDQFPPFLLLSVFVYDFFRSAFQQDAALTFNWPIVLNTWFGSFPSF